MAKSILDDASIDIPCPQCGKETSKSIGWIKANQEFACPGCGNTIRLDSEAAIRELQKADNALDDLRAALKNFGKRH